MGRILTDRDPEFRYIQERLDIEECVPGDWVRVFLGPRKQSELMVFAGTAKQVDKHRQYEFVKVSLGYNRDSVEQFAIWTVWDKDLAVSELELMFMGMYTPVFIMAPGHPKYKHYKGIVDRLEDRSF